MPTLVQSPADGPDLGVTRNEGCRSAESGSAEKTQHNDRLCLGELRAESRRYWMSVITDHIGDDEQD